MKPKVLRWRRHNSEAESTSSRTCKISQENGVYLVSTLPQEAEERVVENRISNQKVVGV